jgi:hypothetical protein
MDEFEALRLADLEGLYQEQAAERMNVSRQTFGRIVESARRKVAQVIAEGLALRIEGGAVKAPENRKFTCDRCKEAWGVPYGAGKPEECPKCKNRSVHCSDERGSHMGSKANCRRNSCRSGTS